MYVIGFLLILVVQRNFVETAVFFRLADGRGPTDRIFLSKIHCHGHGHLTTTATCICFDGWTGDTCEVFNPWQRHIRCKHDTECFYPFKCIEVGDEFKYCGNPQVALDSSEV